MNNWMINIDARQLHGKSSAVWISQNCTEGKEEALEKQEIIESSILRPIQFWSHLKSEKRKIVTFQ